MFRCTTVSGQEGAPFAKERSLMWSRSRLPVGNDCARVPGSSNGTVRKQYPGQWSWEALMYMTQVSYLVFSIRQASSRGQSVCVRIAVGGWVWVFMRRHVAAMSGRSRPRIETSDTAFAGHDILF